MAAVLASLFGTLVLAAAPAMPAPPEFSAAWCPVAAFDGQRVVVAWSAPEGVFAANLSADGRVESRGRIDAATALWGIAAAKGVTIFLFGGRAEANGTEILARRFRGATPLDPQPLRVGVTIGAVALAASDEQFLVVWEGGQTRAGDLYGVRLPPAPGLTDPTPLLLVSAPGEQRQAAVAALGRDFFVAWNDNRRHCPNAETPCYAAADELYAARVSGKTGQLIADPWRVDAIAYNAEPVLTSAGEDAALVWPQRPPGSGSFYRWVASRIPARGQPSPAMVIDNTDPPRSPAAWATGLGGFFFASSRVVEVNGTPYRPGGPGGQATRLAFTLAWLPSELGDPGSEWSLFEDQPTPCLSVVNDEHGPWLIYDARGEQRVKARRLSQQGWRAPAVELAAPSPPRQP